MRTARKREGLNQKELADALGLKNKQSISDWESGKSMPKTETLLKISKLLKVSLDWLMFGSFPQLEYENVVKEKEELYKKVQELSEQDAETIINPKVKRKDISKI